MKFASDDIIEREAVAAVYGHVTDEAGVRNLFRTDQGHTKLDFTKAEPAELLFAHNNGFLLKFRPKDDREWLTLIEQAKTIYP